LITHYLVKGNLVSESLICEVDFMIIGD
jgi:hypothetical protein